MIDQANDLRRLVMGATQKPSDTTARPRMVLVAGGKGGVGTTTIAVNLAVSLAQNGLRIVLVDADPDGADVQTLCRLRQRYTISDVLNGKRTLRESLQAGPAGVMILPGAWAVADLADATERSQERLLGQFAGLANRADAIVFDGGNGQHAFTRRLWHACEELVLVTSADVNAILDTYAVMKVACDPTCPPRIHLLVNTCSGAKEAAEIHDRISRSSQRFLGFGIPSCRWLPADANVITAGRQGMPFTLSQTTPLATESLADLARYLDRAPAAQNEGEIFTIQNILPNRLNPDGENADSEDDRSLFARC